MPIGRTDIPSAGPVDLQALDPPLYCSLVPADEKALCDRSYMHRHHTKGHDDDDNRGNGDSSRVPCVYFVSKVTGASKCISSSVVPTCSDWCNDPDPTGRSSARQRCQWRACSECEFCTAFSPYPPPPPSPPPPPPRPLGCSLHCDANSALWIFKCEWPACETCAECTQSPPPPVATGLHAQPQQGGKEETEEPFAAAGGTTPAAAAGPDGSVGRRSYLPAERHAVHLTPMSGLHGVALADAPSWSDEFETCSATTGMLDPSVWTYERGFKRNPGDEVQYYREESVRCHNGKLVITASEHSDGKWYTESEAARCSSEVPEEHRPRYCAKLGEKIFFTSGSIQTDQRATGALLLGQYDARIRVPYAANIWPAWWTVGSWTGELGAWPQNGEIDILEFHHTKLFAGAAYATSADEHDHSSVQWTPTTAEEAPGKGRLNDRLNVGVQWGSSFHNYSMVWTECCLDFFVDTIHVEHVDLRPLDHVAKPHNPYRLPGRLPQILKFNVAVPPTYTWFAHLARGASTPPIEWPLQMEVEYVRYYPLASPPVPPMPPSPPSLPPAPPMPPPPPPPLLPPILAPTPFAEYMYDVGMDAGPFPKLSPPAPPDPPTHLPASGLGSSIVPQLRHHRDAVVHSVQSSPMVQAGLAVVIVMLLGCLVREIRNAFAVGETVSRGRRTSRKPPAARTLSGQRAAALGYSAVETTIRV